MITFLKVILGILYILLKRVARTLINIDNISTQIT